MSASESLIKNAVNNWSPPWEVDRIEDVEVSDYPIDGKGSPYRVFVTYKDSTENRKYHRTGSSPRAGGLRFLTRHYVSRQSEKYSVPCNEMSI